MKNRLHDHRLLILGLSLSTLSVAGTFACSEETEPNSAADVDDVQDNTADDADDDVDDDADDDADDDVEPGDDDASDDTSDDDAGGVGGMDSGVGGAGGEPAAGGDGGTAGGGSSAEDFPDDGLQRDPSFSAGSVPLPEAVTEIPMLLSETGLYADAANEVFAYDVRLFEPQHKLWTDTATKRRWFYIPAGEQIDTTDMDNWAFPVGTKVWKEFTRGDVRVETRILWRVATGGRGWIMVAYIWNAEQTDAVAAPMGLENASDTAHDVPGSQLCADCHGDRQDKILGVSAVQLSHAGPGMNLTDLIERNLLSSPPTSDFVIPGNETEVAALGYLHANCGHCHRENTSAASRADLRMWLLTDQLDAVTSTDAYTYLVNQPVYAGTSVLPTRIVGGEPEMSEVIRRMALRDGGEQQMPPIGTEDPDLDALSALNAWINTLPAPQ